MLTPSLTGPFPAEYHPVPSMTKVPRVVVSSTPSVSGSAKLDANAVRSWRSHETKCSKSVRWSPWQNSYLVISFDREEISVRILEPGDLAAARSG
jgi:hypothetical protein